MAQKRPLHLQDIETTLAEHECSDRFSRAHRILMGIARRLDPPKDTDPGSFCDAGHNEVMATVQKKAAIGSKDKEAE